MLVDGKSESDGAILDRLIDQWIVRSEADTGAFFRIPADVEMAPWSGTPASVVRIAGRISGAEKKNNPGLSDKEIDRMVAEQLYLSNYLDSRFRPAVAG